ncbi:hypothetical protein [Caballeronia sp. RCC_10]|jgi:hypothetical protein
MDTVTGKRTNRRDWRDRLHYLLPATASILVNAAGVANAEQL